MVRSIAVLLVGGLLSACAAPLWAQQAILGQMYGNGVHAYFSGEYVRAHQLLTAAIDAGSHDPRCYYFRGLCYLRLGRPQEAETDFQQGAKLETADLNKTYSVAKSLERIQGTSRAEVERYRIQARMAALDRSEKDRQRRYEETNRLERQSLESQAGAAPTKAPGTEPIAAPPAAQPAAQPDNPFGVPEKNGPEPAPKATPEPAANQEPEPAAKQEPAAKPAPVPTAKPEAKPATEDPFAPAKPGPESAKPATETAPGPGKAASPDKKHGFGGALKQALGRALGGDENKAASPAAEKPAAERPSAEPGVKAPTPVEKPAKADEKPAAKPGDKPPTDDPFADVPPADEKPAKKPAAKEPAAKKPAAKESATKKPDDNADPFGG